MRWRWTFTYRKATVTLPLYRGLAPDGKDVFYIITDASDFQVAKRMGINYAPKLVWARGAHGAQPVTLDDRCDPVSGVSPTSRRQYKVTPWRSRPAISRPKPPLPGAVADAKWSSIVVLPSGLVLNAQIVQNDSGSHDRAMAVDVSARNVTMSILDGVRGGQAVLLPPGDRRFGRRAGGARERASTPRPSARSRLVRSFPAPASIRRSWASRRC